MKKPSLYDSAYPGSMMPREDGAYVERTDSESLAAALLRNLYEAKSAADDWMNEAIRHEKEANELRAKLASAPLPMGEPFAYFEYDGHGYTEVSEDKKDSPDVVAAYHVLQAAVPDWEQCEQIADQPPVDEALRAFLEDATADNATCLVREIMRAGAAPNQQGNGSTVDVGEIPFKTVSGMVIDLRDVAAVKAEYYRLDGWRARWLKLANDRTRMRGILQSKMDYIVERSLRAERRKAQLLHVYWDTLKGAA